MSSNNITVTVAFFLFRLRHHLDLCYLVGWHHLIERSILNWKPRELTIRALRLKVKSKSSIYLQMAGLCAKLAIKKIRHTNIDIGILIRVHFERSNFRVLFMYELMLGFAHIIWGALLVRLDKILAKF